MTLSILYCLTAGSAITDILKNKIFNKWLLVGGIAGMISRFACMEAGRSLTEIIIKAALITIILLPIYLVKGIGGGDLKLFTVISIFLPMGEMIGCLLSSFVIGAFIGIIKIIITGKSKQTIHFAVPILISILLITRNSALICM